MAYPMRQEFSKTTKREALKRSGGNCEAPSCERKAIIHRGGFYVCNLHYQRLLSYDTFELPEKNRSRDCKCSGCGKEFDRGYAMNWKRASKPQFCSAKCKTGYLVVKANNERLDRFWSKVDISTACWEWKAFCNKSGYGQFQFSAGNPVLAHRYSYEVTYGPFDEALFVCHKCDNPSCVRPDHLFLGTHNDNMADCVAKGRTNKVPRAIGHEVNTSKLTAFQVIEIYQSAWPVKDLANLYGVSTTAIGLIKKGKNWGWLTGVFNVQA